MLQPSAGQNGFLRVSKASVRTDRKVREDLILSCITNDGTPVPVDTARRMLMAPAIDDGGISMPSGLGAAGQDRGSLFSTFAETVKKQNFQWLEEEEQRLDNYARDIEIEIDAQT